MRSPSAQTLLAVVAASLVTMSLSAIANAHDRYYDDDYYYRGPSYYVAPAPVYVAPPPPVVYAPVPSAPVYGYGPPRVAPAPEVIEVVPPRPSSCGKYRYWNGDYCADARYERPYTGPRW